MQSQTKPSRCVAIIPARGGSKRIPDKNIRSFCGVPIIGRSIRAAQESGLFEKIIVSTDSAQIAEVAIQFGAEVPFFRDAELSGDKAGLHSVMADALRQLAIYGISPDFVCCLLATAPMVRAGDLRNGLEMLQQSGARMSLSVTEFPYCIFRALRHDEQGRAVMIWPENLTRHSQEFPQAFHDAGQFYWWDARRFEDNPTMFFSDCVPVFLPRSRVQDIDTLEDWEHAENLFQNLQHE
ncbi:MAG: pseudaminic acid cytidylyltransferase [Prosthecobacter sp.]|nr:pseudaminic acid cytidylyltransferase [Prosthecobacter sp.]